MIDDSLDCAYGEPINDQDRFESETFWHGFINFCEEQNMNEQNDFSADDEYDNAYKDAIDLIANNTFDPRRIAIELAKTYPVIFVALASKNSAEQWHYDYIQLLRKDDSRVPAIKLMREKTGFGLKEALDVTNNLVESMNSRGYFLQAPSSVSPMINDKQLAVYKKLISIV
jgi:hypothetical protein